MMIRDIRNGAYFRAVDQSTLCELLHPAREKNLALRCSIAHAFVRPNEFTQLHKLRTSAEVYYFLEGEGIICVAGETARVRPGLAVYVPPGAEQYLINTGPSNLSFLCIVDPMWQADDEQLQQPDSDNTFPGA